MTHAELVRTAPRLTGSNWQPPHSDCRGRCRPLWLYPDRLICSECGQHFGFMYGRLSSVLTGCNGNKLREGADGPEMHVYRNGAWSWVPFEQTQPTPLAVASE